MLAVPALCTLLALPAGARQDLELPEDRLVLANGREVRGRLLLEDDETVAFQDVRGVTIYERGEVDTIEALRDRLATGLDLLDSLPYGSIGLHLDAVATLERLGLAREARLVCWRILGFDPEEPRAHEVLGSRRTGGRWLVPFGGRPTPLDQARTRSQDWSDAWRFETTHFRLRSNLPLEGCVRTCFDLERIYRGFYELFGEELGLFEVVEPLEVRIHADRRSYPELSGHLGGYFAPDENRLYIDASAGLDRRLIAHEVTHQLLFNTARSTHRSDGRVPGWLDEGLAQYAQAAAHPVGEGLQFRPGTEIVGWFALQAEAEDPLPLSRVLNLTASDFRAGESRLRYAQSWSLVQFCLHARGGEYRERFVRFVRGCFAGQASPSHFDRAFAGRSAELEREWTAWVAARAE